MTIGRSAPSDPRKRVRRVEKKPKSVVKAPYFSADRLKNDPARQDELLHIIESIERGDGVPERYYRARIDDDHDRFLAKLGVIHLHLEDKASDTLVFLVQYTTRVVLVAMGDHDDLSVNPPSRVLRAIEAGSLHRFDREAAQEQASAAALAKAAAAADTAERERRRSAAVADLKASLRMRKSGEATRDRPSLTKGPKP